MYLLLNMLEKKNELQRRTRQPYHFLLLFSDVDYYENNKLQSTQYSVYGDKSMLFHLVLSFQKLSILLIILFFDFHDYFPNMTWKTEKIEKFRSLFFHDF